jgi:hypothetical protein
MYNWIGESIFKPVILLRIVKPLGMPSGVRIVTPSPASTAAQVPERLALMKVRRHGRLNEEHRENSPVHGRALTYVTDQGRITANSYISEIHVYQLISQNG